MSIKSQRKKIDLRKLVRLIKITYQERLKAACIFGSYATGELTGSSDLDILIILEPDHSRKDYSAFGDNVEVFFEKWLMNPLLLGYKRINQFKPIYISLLKGYIPLFGNKIIETIVSKSRKLIDEKKINIVGKTIIAPHDLRFS